MVRWLDGSVHQAVMLAAGAYRQAVFIEAQALAVLAHPADLAGGVADDEGIRLYFLGDHGPCANEGVGSDVVATNDGGIGPDGGPFADHGFHVFPFAVHGAAGVMDIGEDHARPQKNVIFADHAFINGDVVLHFDIIPQYHPIGHKNILPQIAAFPNDRPRHDVAEMPDRGLGPDAGPCVNDGGGVGVIWRVGWLDGWRIRWLNG